MSDQADSVESAFASMLAVGVVPKGGNKTEAVFLRKWISYG